MEDKNVRFIELTADIVSAYVGNNPVPAAQLPELIASVSGAVLKLGNHADHRTHASHRCMGHIHMRHRDGERYQPVVEPMVSGCYFR